MLVCDPAGEIFVVLQVKASYGPVSVETRPPLDDYRGVTNGR